MTGFTSGMLNERVTFIRPGETVNGQYGRTRTPGEEVTRWAAVDWVKGVKAMQEGATDAYDTIMIRCRFCDKITRDCKVRYKDTLYNIQSFYGSKHKNTIQITAKEIAS